MASQWLAILLALGFALATAFLLIFAATLAGPGRSERVGTASGQVGRRPPAIPVGLFAAALVSLLLCAQTAVLFPWAASFHRSAARFSWSALLPICGALTLVIPVYFWMVREGMLGSRASEPKKKRGDRR